MLDDRANLLEGEALLDRAADPYVFVRSVWLQRREYQVRDGNVPDKPDEFENSDAADDAAPPPTP